jgi:hypothetical protein
MPTAGKRGANPRDFSVKVPTLEAYLTNPKALPYTPNLVNWESAVTDWPMYMNDQIGDCTIAGMFHAIGAMSTYASGKEVLFTDNEAVSVYSAISGYVPGNPNTDVGCTLQQVCQYMQQTGAVDTASKTHKLAGYAEIGDYTNTTLLKQCLYTFGSVYVAVNLPESAEEQFEDGEPWTPVSGSPIAGGHCIVLQWNEGDVIDGSSFVTWGATVRANNAWIFDYVCEAVALVSQDWVDANGTSPSGLDLAQLIADSNDVGAATTAVPNVTPHRITTWP